MDIGNRTLLATESEGIAPASYSPNGWPERQWLKTRLGPALDLLLAASQYGQGERRRQFAIRMSELRMVGVSAVDMRWMYLEGLAEHLVEITQHSNQRQFTAGNCHLQPASCFLLTELGYSFACENANHSPSESLIQQSTPPSIQQISIAVSESSPKSHHPGSTATSPSWDQDRQELWFGGKLVKRYRLPSPNQNAILSAFEEEGWPARIDDPLPPRMDQDPKRRLHDTIRNLNRAQQQTSLRFSGDGAGMGVLWAHS